MISPQKFRRKWSIPARSKSSSSENSGRSRTRSKRDYLRIGITGGIGSGKTTACRFFRSLGRTVLEADAIARQLMREDEAMRSAIIAAFGASAYLPDGTPDKETLRSIVFDSPTTRKRLNAIVHPRVIARITRTLDALPAETRTPYTLVEAALIFESGMENELDYTVVVHADDAIRIRRTVARDQVPPETVTRTFEAQLPSSIQKRKADFVLENNGTEDELRSSVLFLDHLLSHLRPVSA